MSSKTNSITEIDKDNPLYPLQLHKVANAKTEEELKAAIENSVSALHRFDQTNDLQEYQKAVKAFLSDPSNPEKAKKLTETIQSCANISAVRRGSKLKDSVSEVDRDSVDEIRDSLIAQYQATVPSEIMLVDLALSSYFRALRTNQGYHQILHYAKTNAPQEQVNFLKEMGRQIEFAHKQFMTAITFLKELKQPPIKVKIQTRNAFVANNQQVNQYEEKTPIANDLGKK